VGARKVGERTITPAQIKAARSLLGWTQVELSRRSNVPNSVIALYETRTRSPARGTIGDLRKTLEAAGFEFFDGGSGVRSHCGDA
jgi:transcriptional regulator with XRE-family HTH domain